MNDSLKALLKEYNISNEKIAQQMGITRQAVHQRLQCKDISLSTLQAIADTINISLSALIEQLETSTPPQVDELTLLRRENELLRSLIADKDIIINLLTRKSEE